MAEVSCCNPTDHEILLAILETENENFDRLAQVIQTINTSSGSSGSTGTLVTPADLVNVVAGTAVGGANVPVTRGVLVTAPIDNVGSVYIGASNVTNGSGSFRGLILSQGGMSSTLIPASNLNQIYINADNAGDRVGVILV